MPENPKSGNSIEISKLNYEAYPKKATLDLMNFLGNLLPGENPLCVTYFDDAHELRSSFWILLHLLQAQEPSTRMWYVFMSTKSSISDYDPSPENREPSQTTTKPTLLTLL
jgi:hypothetical protein